MTLSATQENTMQPQNATLQSEMIAVMAFESFAPTIAQEGSKSARTLVIRISVKN
jgi:hypothetical protein